MSTLVVGGGLAGCFVCWELMRHGYAVTLVDEERRGTATPVAAGLYNPIRFRDLGAVNHARRLVSLLRARLGELEAATGEHFHAPVGIARIFGDSAARERWATRAAGSEAIGPVLEPHELPHGMRAPYGAGYTQYSGWIDPELLRSALHTYLTERGSLINGTAHPDAFTLGDHGVTFQQGSTRIEASALVLCRGPAAAEQPRLLEAEHHLPPIETLRGETLHVRAHGVELTTPVHRRVYVVPRQDGTAVVGSTYERENRDLEPTAEARHQLLRSLGKIVDGDVEVLQQRVGLRPITRDGMPMAGLLQDRVAVVNGLGPKGVLWGPAAAAVAVAELERAAGSVRSTHATRSQDAVEHTLVTQLAQEWRPDRKSAF